MSKNKEYFNKFIISNGDKIKEKITCDICKGQYTYFNKSHHVKSKKHMNICELNEKDKEIEELKNNIIYKITNFKI
jgi:hypothetical protein